MIVDVAAETVRTSPRTFGARQVVGMMPFKGTCVQEVRDKTPDRFALLDAATDAVQWQHALTPQEEIAFDPTATYVAIISIEGVGEARFAVSRVSDGSAVGSGRLNIDFVGKVAISPDARTLAVSRSSGDVRFVDVKSARMTEPQVLHPVYIQSIAFRPTDVGLITYQINGRGYVWDLALGYPGAVVIAPKTPVVHSESGYWIALMTDEGIRVFGSTARIRPEKFLLTRPLKRSPFPTMENVWCGCRARVPWTQTFEPMTVSSASRNTPRSSSR